MLFTLTRRMLFEPAPRVLFKFLFTFGWNGQRAMAAFSRRAARGHRSPAFLFISLTDRCNLQCRGCWVTPTTPSRTLTYEEVDAMITEYKVENRCRFFGLLGGEPLLVPYLEKLLRAHPDCYFQVLTNGTLLDDSTARTFRRLGNVTPLISVEGGPEESDRRRGGDGVYDDAMRAIAACRRHRLVTGVATSVSRGNIDDLVSEKFVRDLIGRGVHYLWMYIYRPVGPDPAVELALDEEQILQLRRFLVEARCRFPILLIDAYWDAEGRAVCPAAEGISHHVGPGGDIEPCPPIQFSRENIRDGQPINHLFQGSSFLEEFRRTAAANGRGCILLENPTLLSDVVERTGARDTSGRATGLRELAKMRARPCHDLPGREIPEKHWMYRMAKKRWFFGFGAYG